MTGNVTGQRVLYVIACATPAAGEVGKLVGLAQDQGWTVCVVTTPKGTRFIDQAALEQQTGFPVRSDYKQPGTPDLLPPANAMIAAPASFNTVNKWAAGISDTLAVGLLTEAVGLGLPLVALPFLNRAQAAHPALSRSVKELRDMGVKVLLGEGGFTPRDPGHGDVAGFPWKLALEALA